MHVILVSNNCSLLGGGESALSYRWFEGLRGRGVRVSLVTHVRNRDHLTQGFCAEPTIHYINDERYARRIWRAGHEIISASDKPQLSWATTGAILTLAFELQARAYIRKNLLGPETIIHRVAPIAPRWPYLFRGLGVRTLAGPLSALPELPTGFAGYAKKQGLRAYGRLRYVGRFVNAVLPPPHRILCANEYTLSCLPRRWRSRCSIMPENGITVDGFKPCFDANDPAVIMMVSRLSAEKFCELGIRAFKIVRDRCAARLVVIGDGPERNRLEQLVSQMKLIADVDFLGHLSHAEVLACLPSADVYFHPSVRDASPTSVLEAMASGKPTVCADVGGHAEWIKPDCGVAVPSESPNLLVSGFAQAMVELIRSPQRRIDMGHAAVAKVKARFVWPAKIDAMLSIYASLLESAGGC